MIAKKIAEYICAESSRKLPDVALHGARRCLVDWVATTVPGGVRAPATVLIDTLGDEMDPVTGQSELVPSGLRTSARTAALINASASHTVEFDDIYRDGIYHPGSPVISAALAAAQGEHLSGIDFLRAIVVGYEVSNRIAACINPAHYRFWHTTATVGALGAAAAASSAYKLTPDQTRHAISAVTTLAAGLQQTFLSESMGKPLHVGNASANGVLCANAARHGLTGASAMLEGEYGFGAALCDEPDWDRIFDGLGEDYTITRMTQKNHGCCGHTFAAIDGALTLRRQHSVDPAEVARVVVRTYGAALKITSNRHPVTEMEARFSMPFVVACALTQGAVRLRAFEEDNLKNQKLLDLASCVVLELDPELDAAFPGQRAAIVEIELKSGKVLSHYQPTRKGDPDDPLTDDEIEQKLRELVEPVIGSADALSRQLWHVDDERDMAGFFSRAYKNHTIRDTSPVRQRAQ